MSRLPLSPSKKAVHKQSVTRRFQAMNLPIPSSLKKVFILCGTNNIFTDFPMDIVGCIVNIGCCLREKSSNMNVFICGLIPRDKSWPVNRALIKNINTSWNKSV